MKSIASTGGSRKFVATTVLAVGSLSLLLLDSVNGAYISGFTAPKGSMAGGTYLTVWGSGFGRNGKEGQTLV